MTSTNLNSILREPTEPIIWPENSLDFVDQCFTAEDGSPVAKTNNIAQATLYKNLEKVKSTQTYGIRSVYYAIFLPLKQRIAGLSNEEKTDLDLYNSHQEICTLVDRVKKAYEAYVPAAEAVHQAPKNKVAAANSQKLDRSVELIHSYNALVRRATAEADRLSGSVGGNVDRVGARNGILRDVQESLGNEGLIFNTVNMERARTMVSNGPAEKLSQRYNEFVRNFVTHVQQAIHDSGDNIDVESVTHDFILGLASIPALAKNYEIHSILANLSPTQEDGIVELLKPEKEEVVQFFLGKLNGLIHSQTPINSAALENIQHKGLSLVSVLGSNIGAALKYLSGLQKDIHSLKELENSNQRLGSDQEQMVVKEKQSQAKLKDLDAKLNAKSTYTVNELFEFLKDNVKEITQFLGDSSIEPYRTVRELLEAEKQIAVLEKQSKEERVALDQQIQQAQRQVENADASFRHLTEILDNSRRNIAIIEKTIVDDDAKLNSDINGLRSKGNYDILIISAMQGRRSHKELIEADLRLRNDEVKQQEIRLKDLEKTAKERAKGLADLQAEAAQPDSKETRKDLASFRAIRNRLATQTFEISGRELLNLGDYLEIGDVSSTIGTQLTEVRKDQDAYESVEAEIRKLSETNGNLESQRQENAARVEQIKANLAARGLDKLALQPDFFRHDEAFVVAAVKSNLDIAREVTRQVSQAIADRKSGRLARMREEAARNMSAEDAATLDEMESRFVMEEKKLPATPPMDIVAEITGRLSQLKKTLKESISLDVITSLPPQLPVVTSTERDSEGRTVYFVPEL